MPVRDHRLFEIAQMIIGCDEGDMSVSLPLSRMQNSIASVFLFANNIKDHFPATYITQEFAQTPKFTVEFRQYILYCKKWCYEKM